MIDIGWESNPEEIQVWRLRRLEALEDPYLDLSLGAGGAWYDGSGNAICAGSRAQMRAIQDKRRKDAIRGMCRLLGFEDIVDWYAVADLPRPVAA